MREVAKWRRESSGGGDEGEIGQGGGGRQSVWVSRKYLGLIIDDIRIFILASHSHPLMYVCKCTSMT